MRPLYCDESIWVPVADGLRRRRWDVRVARDEGMLGEPDRTHLTLVVEHDWILVTFDDDFLSLVEAERVDTCRYHLCQTTRESCWRCRESD